MADLRRTLKHVAQYSPLLNEPLKAELARAPPNSSIKERFSRERLPLSELPLFLNGTFKLDVPVYTVWGACEDVSVLEKLRSGEYKINNLHIIDEAHSRLLDVGGVKLRLLGLGGAVVMHKLFDNGEGRTTIAGGQGTMFLQIGELVDTANRVYDPTETRVFITHASPAREGLFNQLSVTLKADFSISAGLHFRYGSSYNEFSVNPTLDHYRGKLAASKASFNDVWETVKHEVEPAVAENESQQRLLAHALDVVSKMPSVANGGNPFGGGQGPQSGQVDESAFKNMWNFNLADAAFGYLVLEVDQGRIGTEMRAQGFNFSHRGSKAGQRPVAASNNQMPVEKPVSRPPPQQFQQQQPQQMPARAAPTTAAQVLSQNAGSRPTGPSGPAATQQAPPTQSPAPTRQASTPQVPAATNGAAVSPAANGTTPAPRDDKLPESPRPEPAKPSNAIFVPGLPGITSEDEMKAELFSEEDRAKITKVEKTGLKGFWIVSFENPETMEEVLKRSPKEGSRFSNLKLSPFRARQNPRGGGFSGQWGSTRGGAAGAPPQQSGYRSSGASDSESGRGGRGGRGAFRARGDRGRGRGGRGGPGGPVAGGPAKAEGGGSAPAPAAAPAPSGGDA